MPPNPEGHLLQACIQWSPGRSTESAVAERAAAVTDWAAFSELADTHSLLPMAADCLATCRAPLPDGVSAALARAFRENAKRVLVLTAELLRIVSRLEDSGISPLAFKGPTLAHAFYPDPAWRVFTDIDLLIREEELPRARRVLEQEGYVPAGDEHLIRVVNAFLPWYTVLPLAHPVRGTSLDLHWDLLPRGFPARMPAGFRERAQTVLIDGKPVRTPGSADYLLYLCLHGAKHEWSNAMWVMDLCRVMQRSPEIDYERLAETARDNGAELMLQYGLRMAAEPAGAVTACSQGSRSMRESGLSGKLLWQLSDSRLAALLYLLRLAVTPTTTDFTTLRIRQRAWYFLYVPWRLCRLCIKYARRAR